jgi:hypothetical protein
VGTPITAATATLSTMPIGAPAIGGQPRWV